MKMAWIRIRVVSSGKMEMRWPQIGSREDGVHSEDEGGAEALKWVTV